MALVTPKENMNARGPPKGLFCSWIKRLARGYRESIFNSPAGSFRTSHDLNISVCHRLNTAIGLSVSIRKCLVVEHESAIWQGYYFIEK